MKNASSRFLLLGLSALLAACLEPEPEELSREYPIAAGRYYSARELATKSPDSALFYTDYDPETRLYMDTHSSPPGCRIYLLEGSWFVYTNTATPEPVLKKKYLRAAGSTGREDCQILDSLTKARTDWSESYWIRNITDTSFETCDNANAICHGKCNGKSANPSSTCYGFDSTRTLASYWDRWVKR